jgi:hypothetical protein
VSRWYVLGGDGRSWDGSLAAGQKRAVNVIGYLGEAVNLRPSSKRRRTWARSRYTRPRGARRRLNQEE